MATGPVRLVVIGFCPVTTGRLEELCRRIRTLADVDAVARGLPGSFHVVAADGATTRVQGSVTGLRQVFHTRLGEVPIAADRADALAALTGAGIDMDALATRVVCGACCRRRSPTAACGRACPRWRPIIVCCWSPAAGLVRCAGGGPRSPNSPWKRARRRCGPR
ncbi:hypothetical protein SAZ11_13555 [Streptomyces sp. FXJ1.4098]|nr:hypothetical protein [Streptomyces sp. FXJ1.4098]